MLKNCLILFIAACSALNQATNASLISRGDGVSVTGRLNQDGLSSTVIKTQHLNGPDEAQLMSTGNNDAKNDDAHFRIFYKANAPGRSVKHEMEHRFYKNPNFLSTTPSEQQYQSNPGFNPLLNLLQQQQQPQQQQLPLAYSSFIDNLNSNALNSASYSNRPNNNDRSTMFNLHYHNNYDYAPSDQLLQLQQQKLDQQEQYEQARKTSLLKLMLANFVSAQSQQQQNRPYPKPLEQQQPPNNNNNNGVQYKIVNLKFRIEPQQGKLIGQGIVGTNNGAGSILNSQHFNLWPNELPALVRSILNHAQASQQQQQQQNHPQPAAHHIKGSFSYGHGFLKKKRGDDSEESEPEAFEKRSAEAEAGERKRRSSEDEEALSEELDERARREDEGEEESDETVNDNDFQESFKSLQRRDDEAEEVESGDEAERERPERNYEGEEEAVPMSELDQGDENY